MGLKRYPVLTGQYTSLTAAQWRHSFPAAILDEVQKAPSLVDTINDNIINILPKLFIHGRRIIGTSADLI